MLDLNIGIAANHHSLVSPHHDKDREVEEEEIPEGSGTNTELSGSSSASSVVNAAADEFNFFPSGEFVTRKFFPVREAVEREKNPEVFPVGSSQPANSTNHQWLNLAVSGSGFRSDPVQGNTQQVRRSRRGPRSRSSQYRGVTFYRRTGRWESHIWDCGKQVYLGGFDTAHTAARAYDRAAIKFRGVDADINFNVADYEEDMKQTKNLTKEEFIHILRRQSTGFFRGSSRYKGVTLHKCGRWEGRMGQFLGKKAYDKAAIQCNGREAVTNFEPSSYEAQIPIQAGNGGDGQNLDLNLGISMAIDGPEVSNNMESGNGGSTCFPRGMQTLYGQPLASRESTVTWSGLRPGQAGTYEDKVGDQNETSARTFSNWTWYNQSQGQGGGGGGASGGTTKKQVQLLTAASSGFSLTTTTSSPTTFPLFSNPETHLPPATAPSTRNSFHHNGLDR